MGQQSSSSKLISETTRSHSQLKRINRELQKSTFKYEGILKIGKTPFEGCRQIQINYETYFLQQTKICLKDLIKQRSRLKKSFTQQEVVRLIESMIYVLAYLENSHASYPYLSPQNIFLCDKIAFKVLPPSVLKHQIYAKLKQCLKQKIKQYVPASPQMIIAVRCQQPSIKEEQILAKSNVFALGLILLQVCTLKSSAQCYDLLTYDILDEVVSSKIQEIEGKYSKKIVRIVANMLDYDFQERMTPKQMSIWVNRTLNEPDEEYQEVEKYNQPVERKPQQFIAKSRLIEERSPSNKSRLAYQQSQPQLQPVPLPPPSPSSKIVKNTRIQEIRAKINKEKLSQVQTFEQKQLTKSRNNRSRTPTKINKDRNKQKILPNPYLNLDHINKSTDKNSNDRNKQYSSPYRRKQELDLGIHNIDKLRVNYDNNKYQYSNPYGKEIPSNKSINLKYKYNLKDQGDGLRLNSSKIRESQRHMRIESEIQNYRKSLSGKKYDQDAQEKQEQEKNVRDSEQKNKIGKFSFLPEQGDKQRREYNISDFQPHPSNYPQKAQQPYNKYGPLEQTSNYFNQFRNEPKKYDRQSKPNPYEVPYERHQNIFGFENKGNKNYAKQNQEISLIKKQIERSKRIIQQVKRNQNSG